MKTVYLAGPISNCSYGECTSWRDEAEASLKEWGIKGLSPMRGKAFLAHVEKFTQNCAQYSDNPLSTPRGIMTRDRYDATHCDVLLVNLLGAEKVSIGTVMEIAWADAKRTPVVLVMEADGSNPHEHSMIHEAIGYRVDNLPSAIDITRLILGASHPIDTTTDRFLANPMFGVVPSLPVTPLDRPVHWFDPIQSPHFNGGIVPVQSTGAASANPFPTPKTGGEQ